jgi:hypothetical protein
MRSFGAIRESDCHLNHGIGHSNSRASAPYRKLTPEQRRKWEAMTGAPFQLAPVDAPTDGPADNPKARKKR